MEIFRFSLGKDIPLCPFPLLLGNFDGFHKGHMRLIEAAKEAGPFGILFLDPPFPKANEPKVLMTLEDKFAFVRAIGAKEAFVAETDPSFFDLSKEEFIDLVLRKMNPPLLVFGEDYRFGKGGLGVKGDLEAAFTTLPVPLLNDGQEKIGTSRIRAFLKEGLIESANSDLGRPYRIHGTIAKGFQNGRKIGFPTANLVSLPYVLPKNGVYGGLSYLRGKPYLSIINVGNAPTVGKLKEDVVEVYLDGFSGDCYDETLYTEFDIRIRDEIKFQDLEHLKKQLCADLAEARRRL